VISGQLLKWSDETSGVQASAAGPATTFSCGTSTLTDGLKVTYSSGSGLADANTYRIADGMPVPVLIAYADIGGPPTTLQNQILAEPGVIAVDLFDAFSGTPTLAQLTAVQHRVPFSTTCMLIPWGW